MKSMTGYGRATNGPFTVEIQSVNHKFCEISVKTPGCILPMENRIRDFVKTRVRRGKLYVLVNYDRTLSTGGIKLNYDLANRMIEALQELGKNIGLKDDLTLSTLMSFDKSIWRQEESIDIESLWTGLEICLFEAINGVLSMLDIEGEKTKTELLERIIMIRGYMVEVEKKAPTVPLEYAEALKKRLKALLGKEKIMEEARLAQEIALYADKCDITEEIVRTKSHIEQFLQIIDKSEPVGRPLDFLVQELNREINTIGSKANNLSIVKAVLQIKNELEKIREQIQNVE
ncbi:MAG: YicC/YloC family endoribonuclease [bacterium]